MKHIKSILLTLLTALLTLPAFAQDFEYEGLWYTVIDPDAKTCKTRDGDSMDRRAGNIVEGHLTIPSTVTFNDSKYSVVEIGTYGFYGQSNLVSVGLSESLLTIGTAAFCNCIGLSSIDIPKSVASIEEYVFGDCTNLESVRLPSSLTDIKGGTFSGCHKLRYIPLPESLRTIGDFAFAGCVSMEEVYLPPSLQTIGEGAFLNSAITSVAIGDGIQSFGNSAFHGCNRLGTITYTAQNPIQAPEDIFERESEDIYGTATLVMPNATLASIQAVEPWNKFLHIVAKDGEIYPTLTAGDHFEYEGIWYTVIDPDAKTCKTKDSAGDFGSDSFVVGNNVSGDITLPSVVSDGKSEYIVVEIGYAGFRGTAINSITIPETVREIGQAAFGDCISLRVVNLPASMPVTQDGVFQKCGNIAEVNYAAEKPVESAQVLFDGDAYVNAILNAPNALLTDVQETQPWNLFWHINAKDGSVAPAVEGGDFEYEGIWYTVIDVNAKTCRTKAGTFENPGNKVEGSLTIQSSVYDGYFNYEVTEIGEYSFAGNAITSIDFNDSLTAIGENAFYGCTSLNTVSFPRTMPSIEHSVFGGCVNITYVIYHATTPVQSVENLFDVATYNSALLSASNATLQSIQAVVPWNKFYHIVASDGTFAPLTVGEDFEYQGLWYTVIDSEERRVKTRSGKSEQNPNDPYDFITSPGNDVFGDVVIPSVVYNDNVDYTVTEIGDTGFWTSEGITSITLPSTITHIGTSAFSRCPNLIDVNFPNSLRSIGSQAFWGCKSLTSIELPDSLESIEYGVFDGCSGLISIKLPVNVTSISAHAFVGCSNIVSIELPNSLKEIGSGAFAGWNSLKSLTIPISLEILETGAFQGSDSLEEIYYYSDNPLPAPQDVFNELTYHRASLNFPNATLAAIQSVCPWNLFKRINAKDGYIDNSVSSGDDFEYDGIWYTVIDPEAKTVKTKEGHGGETSVTPGNTIEGDLVIPEKVSIFGLDYKVVGIGAYGFAGNRGLTSVSIPESVTSIEDYAFFLCEGMESVILPSTLSSMGERALADCTELTSVKLPGGLRHLSLGTFQGCLRLSEIEFSEGLETIGEVAFESSGAIHTLNLPSTLTRIESHAFAQCNGLREVNLPNSLLYLGPQAFFNCVFSSIKLPGSLEEIGERCFSVCKFDTVTYEASSPITIPVDVFNEYTYQNGRLLTPNASLASVQSTTPWNKFLRITASDGSIEPTFSEGDAFEFEGIVYEIIDVDNSTCKTIELVDAVDELIIPGSVMYQSREFKVIEIGKNSFSMTGVTSVTIPETVIMIGEEGFAYCNSLIHISIPESLTSIGAVAFFGCTNLAEIILPQSLVSLGRGAFGSCSNLKTISLPESISSLETGVFLECASLEYVHLPDAMMSIGSRSFSECVSLTEVNWPRSLIEIQEEAFVDCTSLQSVELPESLTSIGVYAFEGCVGIENIYYLAEYPIEADLSVFSSSIYDTAKLNVPNALLQDVVSTTPWSIFKHINAKDGSTSAKPGDYFQYDGIWYYVIDAVCKKVSTLDEYAFYPDNHYEGELTIPSVVYYEDEEYTVVEIGERSFASLSGLTSVVMPATIIKLGTGAFHGCRNLVSVELSDSLKEVGNGVFNECVALKKVYLPEGLEYVGEDMFSYCTGMESIYIPNSVTSIKDGAFSDCESLTEIVIPNSVISIGSHAFYRCSGLTEIVIPNSVTTIGEQAFRDCGKVATISIPGSVSEFGNYAFNTLYSPSLMTVNYDAVVPKEADDDIFYGSAYSQVTLNMPNARLADIQATTPWNKFHHIIASDGSVGFVQTGDDFEYEGIWYTVIDPEAKTVRTKEEAIYYVPDFMVDGNLDIPATVIHNEEEYSVIEIGRMSFNRTNISSVTLPNTVVNVREYAFAYCNSLKTVTLPASLTQCGYNVFDECYNIQEVNYLAITPIECESSLFNWNVYDNATLNAPNATLADIQSTMPWGHFRYINASDGSVAPVLNEGADFEYEGIWYTVVDSYEQTCKTKAGEANGESVISGNNVAGDIVIPAQAFDGFNYYTVIGIGHDSFLNNTELTSVKLPENVAYLGDSSFSGCSGLVSFEFPTSLTELGAYAFQNCTGLTAMEIPTTVTSIGAGLFSDCSNLASVNLPNSISSIELNTFAACTSLTEIEVPSSVTLIGTGAFIQCTGLSKVDIPTSVESIGISAFAYCTGLTSIEIPTSVKSIGFSAFTGCTGLTSIDIPANVTFIGDSAFAGCDALGAVSYQALKPITAAADVFSNTVYTNVILEAPNAKVADIRSIIPWSLFRHAIASDGSIGFVEAGDEFEYEGIWYTVVDSDAKTCKTKAGAEAEAVGEYVNLAEGNLVIPETVKGLGNEYTVTEIGDASFWGNPDLLSVTIPETVTNIGVDAFSSCQRLTSLVWKGHTRLQKSLVDEIGNPNLLVYVESLQFAPEGMDANVVADGICENLELTPGYAFTPLTSFTALQSRMVKEFRQHTPIGGTAGWETIVLPFDVTSVYAENLGSVLTPFALVTDIYSQRPYWLYEADPKGEWKYGYGIQAGIPYLISTPNNAEYPEYYNVNGPVVFSSDEPQRITPATTAPYAVTWASGREFRSLWLPLDASEASNAMGLNAGVNGLTDDEGQLLAPGSAFHTGIVPKPLEAYVTRLGGEKAMRIMGNQSAVIPVVAENGLDIRVEDGAIHALSATDRTIHVVTPEGVIVRMVNLKAGEPSVIDGLTDGIYLVAGHKLILR